MLRHIRIVLRRTHMTIIRWVRGVVPTDSRCPVRFVNICSSNSRREPAEGVADTQFVWDAPLWRRAGLIARYCQPIQSSAMAVPQLRQQRTNIFLKYSTFRWSSSRKFCIFNDTNHLKSARAAPISMNIFCISLLCSFIHIKMFCFPTFYFKIKHIIIYM